MQKLTWLLLIALTYSSCDLKKLSQEDKIHFENESFDTKPQANGRCYKKCRRPDQNEKIKSDVEIESQYFYSGNDIYQDGIEILRYETTPAFTKWEKKKANKNCLSSDPNDCLVWCLTKSPALYKEVYLVSDTS